MKIITNEAVLVCDHVLGTVSNKPSQGWATINGSAILVEADPAGRTISSCPNVGATIKPCQLTLPVLEGYSGFIRINGKRVCLDTVTGLTDGTPPGTVDYSVSTPGQNFVEATA